MIFFTDKAYNGGPGLHFEAINAFLETQGPQSAQREAHSRTGGNEAADDTSQGGTVPPVTHPTQSLRSHGRVADSHCHCPNRYFFIENPPMLSNALRRFSAY